MLYKELRLACRNGDLATVRRLWSDSSSGARSHALEFACLEGSIYIAEWIRCAHYADAREHNYRPLRKACAGGSRIMVQWLVDKFGLTVEDIRMTAPHCRMTAEEDAEEDAMEDAMAGKDQPLIEACANGHLDLARWLVDRCAISADDMWACFRPNMPWPPHIEQWISENDFG